MKNLLALLVILLLAGAGQPATAQEMLADPVGGGAGDLPPEDALVLPSGDDYDQGADGQNGELVPSPVAEGDEETLNSFLGGPMHAMECCPSYFESSGSWLRRGYWFTEVDFLMLNKSWDRKGLLFAFEGTTAAAPGFQPGLGQPGFGQVLAIDTLTIDGSRPGADGLARVKLGRFLFRDSRNRDHTLEASYYGGGDWMQSSALTASSDTGLQVNSFIDRDNVSFTGAQSMGFNYLTTLDSVEGNYAVKTRLGRDQMELRPNGEWVRTANPTRTYSFLSGVRYMRLNETLNINATGIPNTLVGADDPLLPGAYFVRTNNDLTGGQLGASFAYETARWSVGSSVKGGAYWNRMDLRSNFSVGSQDTNVLNSAQIVNDREDNISFIGEFQILGKWHLRPNLSLRAGFEVLYVDSIALAPHQVNFVRRPADGFGNTGYTPIAGNGDVVCLGSSLGLEFYR